MSAIKVEFDPSQPAGLRYAGTSEDGPVYEEMSLIEAVIERAAAMLVESAAKDAKKAIDESVSAAAHALIDTRLPGMVEEALSRPMSVTDSWGRQTKAGTVLDLIVARVQSELTVKEGHYSTDRSVLSKVIKEQIDYKLSSELSKEVAAAKKELQDQLRHVTRDVLAKAVVDGLR